MRIQLYYYKLFLFKFLQNNFYTKFIIFIDLMYIKKKGGYVAKIICYLLALYPPYFYYLLLLNIVSTFLLTIVM